MSDAKTKEAPGQLVFAGAHARAFCFNPGADRLLVTLDNWRKDRTGFPELRASRSAARAGFSQLCVHSAANDWFLNPDLGPLRTALEAFSAPFRDVRAIGYSMGGYGALLLSRALHLRRVVLLSPQVSIFPARASFETRYRAFAARLDPELDLLPEEIAPELQGVLLFDPGRSNNDRLHARAIASLAPQIRLVGLTFSGHPANHVISDAGMNGRVLDMVLGDDISGRSVRALHRAARERSGQYRRSMRAYLKLRRLRRRQSEKLEIGDRE